MKKIDWYILNKFLTTFFFCIFLFTIISIVIDISEKTDDFVKSGFTLKQIITQYYFGFIPHIVAILFPLFVFISVIFFTSKMAGRSEIVAILASGTSYNRFLKPYWIGGSLLALLLWVSTRYIIPVANEIRTDFQTKYVDGTFSSASAYKSTTTIYFRMDSFTYAGVSYYDTANKFGSSFFMSRFNAKNEMEYNLRAEIIRWDTGHKNWKLENIMERKINGLKEEVSQASERIMNFHLKPIDLRRDEYTKDKLTTPDLDKFILSEELRGGEGLNGLKVERYRRDSTPVSVLILTFIAVFVSSKKTRGGSGSHLAFGIVAAALFILTERFSTMFSTKGNFSPLIAAWTPNMIFALVAFWLFKKTPK